MSDIDELFNELDDKEIVEIESTLDKEKQQRIEKKIMEGIQKENNSKSKFSKKKYVALLLAATFLMGITVYATEKNEWDIAIINYMGIRNADTVQLEDSVVEIGASALSNGVTMKVVSSVGDKNSAYIRIDTDYKLPETFNEETDYIITDGWDTTIYKESMELNIDHGGSMSYFNNDGFLSLMMSISDCEGLNRKNVKVTLSDLYIYHDLHSQKDDKVDHGTLLLKGNWTMSWKYNYRSNVKTYYPIRKVVSNKDTCLLTKLEISPISIRAEAVKNPVKGRTETSQLLINKITMKDGSTIDFNPTSTSGGCKNNILLEGYRDIMEMDEAIDPSEVYSISIGDIVIVL